MSNQEILSEFPAVPSHENLSQTSTNQLIYRFTEDTVSDQTRDTEEYAEEFSEVHYSRSIPEVSTNYLNSIHAHAHILFSSFRIKWSKKYITLNIEIQPNLLCGSAVNVDMDIRQDSID